MLPVHAVRTLRQVRPQKPLLHAAGHHPLPCLRGRGGPGDGGVPCLRAGGVRAGGHGPCRRRGAAPRRAVARSCKARAGVGGPRSRTAAQGAWRGGRIPWGGVRPPRAFRGRALPAARPRGRPQSRVIGGDASRSPMRPGRALPAARPAATPCSPMRPGWAGAARLPAVPARRATLPRLPPVAGGRDSAQDGIRRRACRSSVPTAAAPWACLFPFSQMDHRQFRGTRTNPTNATMTRRFGLRILRADGGPRAPLRCFRAHGPCSRDEKEEWSMADYQEFLDSIDRAAYQPRRRVAVGGRRLHRHPHLQLHRPRLPRFLRLAAVREGRQAGAGRRRPEPAVRPTAGCACAASTCPRCVRKRRSTA